MSQVIITNTGQSVITNAILTDSKVQFKYFKVSDTDYALSPNITDLSDAWLTKDITSWLILDDNSILISCKIEKNESIRQATTFGIYDNDGNLIFVGKPTSPFPPGNEIVFTFTIQYVNIGSVSDFSLLPWNDNELYLLVTNIATQISNQITDINDKLLDAQLSIDELNTKVNSIIEGTRNLVYKHGNSNVITFTNDYETGLWQITLVGIAGGLGPLRVYFNSDLVIDMDVNYSEMNIVTLPIFYEITTTPTTVNITCEGMEIQYYNAIKIG